MCTCHTTPPQPGMEYSCDTKMCARISPAPVVSSKATFDTHVSKNVNQHSGDGRRNLQPHREIKYKEGGRDCHVNEHTSIKGGATGTLCCCRKGTIVRDEDWLLDVGRADDVRVGAAEGLQQIVRVDD